MAVLRVAGAQLPNVVGDIDGNAERVRAAMRWAEAEGVDVLVFPETVLTGYPLEDLVLHDEFIADVQDAVAELAAASGDAVSVLGTVTPVPPRRSWDSMDRSVSISAALLSGGEHRGTYHKVLLPTHGAYDEGKNFAPGDRRDALWRIGDVVAGVCICEDLWSGDGPPEAQSTAGARVIFAPNASPYYRGKPQGRLRLARAVARRNGVPVVYVNLVGGQDSLVFDGGSLVIDGDGGLRHRAAEFREDRFVVDLPVAAPRTVTGPVTTVHTRPITERTVELRPPGAELPDETVQVWQALVIGTRDFLHKNGFRSAILGLSGGIDAAVTAAVAVDALGPEHVHGVAMPAPDSPDDDRTDAEQVADNLGISFRVLPVKQFVDTIAESVRGPGDEDQTRPSQAAHRARAALLTALADEEGHMLLATGNKTELSIGGAALYGDVIGEFAPLRDCPKTLLYTLARYRNTDGDTIPERTLAKGSTARREDDTLPPYRELDAIVERYVELGHGLEDLVAAGFDTDVTVDILRRIDDAEFLRRQTPPGVKITPRAFGTDRQMPISNAWRPYRRADVGDGQGGAAPAAPLGVEGPDRPPD